MPRLYIANGIAIAKFRLGMERRVVIDLMIFTLHDDAVEPDVPDHIMVDAHISALIVGADAKADVFAVLNLAPRGKRPKYSVVILIELALKCKPYQVVYRAGHSLSISNRWLLMGGMERKP